MIGTDGPIAPTSDVDVAFTSSRHAYAYASCPSSRAGKRTARATATGVLFRVLRFASFVVRRYVDPHRPRRPVARGRDPRTAARGGPRARRRRFLRDVSAFARSRLACVYISRGGVARPIFLTFGH